MTKRTYDNNGWLEVKDNPISKAGVFDYLGAEIGAPEPDKIYKVFRPPEELASDETIKSFRLTPFIVDHEMLGKNATPAEKKGIQGVIGENVYYDHPYLRGNIKIFSDAALSDISSGKIDLSPGYRSRYDFGNPGVYEGEAYEVVQRHLRGNHLALVDEGRTGADVAVQDHLVVTIDTKELIRMSEEDKDKKQPTGDENGFTPEQVEQIKQIVVAALAAGTPATDGDPEKKETTDGDSDPEKKTGDAEAEAEKAVEDAEAEAEKAESGDPEAVEAAEVAIETAEEAIAEAKEELDQATTDSLTRRLKRLKRSIASMDEMSSMKRKIARLEKARPTMDTGELLKQIGERDALAQKLTPFIGVFDHAPMTKQQVAEYGVEKLGIRCDKGTESIALNAWMQGRTPDSQKAHATMDTAAGTDSIMKKWGEK
ncbi:DUF2213 domain-containing protein [Morganella morganii subsp. morganii]|uniref:DUF2213 domain-containing protein n=1 Tax=Morganella morganii TaxID=582 RepID=UPI000CE2B291|nr:DUF2213 domain-containing protein [Morganella morganii]AVD59480.1 hypothetical protein C4E49_08670 [Morganella morganii]MBT0427128.1 DUF2213 domain-containing protein [Morganella morganii subsp. morganii]MBT0474188.1 DUF2213 domain-containing protein [Morganella morganii subsp. morganii]MBT0502833.1 DUF2213 domain-containing protein [Morganella morganii subsp. morganii]MBT0521638.1 DUF2213 domain-containing protein [Morganella morganii subsp. morganii]